MIVCQACGTENPTGTRRCTNCARGLDAATQAAVVEKRASHTATGTRWSSVIASVILLIVVIAVVTVLVLHGM